MDDRALAHLLDDAERARFERDGYLLLPGALDEGTLAQVREVAAREDARFRAEPGIGPHHVLNLHDLVGRDPQWLELLDWPSTFPKVWGVLGWHIQLFHTQLIVTPPAPDGAGSGGYGWHQDNNRMNLDLGTHPQPRVSVKVGYFVSPITRPGMGNLCIVPGSQCRGRPEIAIGEQPPGAIEVTADAGDAILFDRRLWHAASTNCSDETRIFVTFGYSHRWLRPKSAMQLDALIGSVDPIRRQLLGWSTSPNAYFDPTDDDVPLREWLRVHVGEQEAMT
jgi:hypothetical protein